MTDAHEYTEGTMYRDKCVHRSETTGLQCGAPKFHPWHGYESEEVSVNPKERQKVPGSVVRALRTEDPS